MKQIAFIPDNNLKTALKRVLCLGKKEEITVEMLNKMEGELYLYNKGIKKIIGLEHCCNIERLWLTSNEIEDVSPLEKLTNLNGLYVNDNKIKDVRPLSNLVNLFYWDVSSNKIEYLSPLKKLVNIDSNFYWHNNPAKDIVEFKKIIQDYEEKQRLSHDKLKKEILMAENPNTTKDELDNLSKSKNEVTRENVAGNPNTHYKTLEYLSQDDDMGVKMAVAKNPNTNPMILDKLFNDNKHLRIIEAISNNPSIDEHTKQRMLDYGYIKNEKRLFIDMDGTLAEFKYEAIEKLEEKGYFLNLKPHENVVNAIKQIIKNRNDVDVYILSAVLKTPYAENEKNQWLDKYLPEISKEKRIFTECGVDKPIFIEGGVSEKDVLLDDYTVNLNEWSKTGTAVKLDNDINGTNGTWQGLRVDYSNQHILVEKLNKVLDGSLLKELEQKEINKIKGRSR